MLDLLHPKRQLPNSHPAIVSIGKICLFVENIHALELDLKDTWKYCAIQSITKLCKPAEGYCHMPLIGDLKACGLLRIQAGDQNRL